MQLDTPVVSNEKIRVLRHMQKSMPGKHVHNKFYKLVVIYVAFCPQDDRTMLHEVVETLLPCITQVTPVDTMSTYMNILKVCLIILNSEDLVLIILFM